MIKDRAQNNFPYIRRETLFPVIAATGGNLRGQCNIGNATDGFCLSTYDLCHSHDDHMDHRQAMMTTVLSDQFLHR